MDLKNQFELRLALSLSKRFEVQKSLAARKLREAMAYALLGEGKRLRPLMVLDSAKKSAPKEFSKAQIFKYAMPAALAVEYVHAYSLVHDDLPCMDDDDFRRGKLSVHKKFGEAAAVLVGDALLSDAFEILANSPINAAKQCAVLAKAIGSTGMVLGQFDDLSSLQKTRETLINKTGKLFECASRLGALSVGAATQIELELANQGAKFGFQFQLADDLADGEDNGVLF